MKLHFFILILRKAVLDFDITAGFVKFFSYYSQYTFAENETYRAATYFEHERAMTMATM